MTVAVNGDVASVTVNAVDDLGHKITGSYNNIPYTLDGGGWSLSKLSTASKIAKHAKKQLAPRAKVKASSMMIKK